MDMKARYMASCPSPTDCKKQLEKQIKENPEAPPPKNMVIGAPTGYHLYSNICSTAVHAGVTTQTQEGHLFGMTKVGQSKNFMGTTRNGISAYNATFSNDQYEFQLSTFDVTCPQQVYKNQLSLTEQTSFFQTRTSFKNRSRETEDMLDGIINSNTFRGKRIV